MSKKQSVPSYLRHHRRGLSDRAFVLIPLAGGRRKRVYLGEGGSPESHERYEQVLAEWRVGAFNAPLHDATVVEVFAGFIERVLKVKYVGGDGELTNHGRSILRALKAATVLYGRKVAVEFGPLALKAIRQKFIDQGLG